MPDLGSFLFFLFLHQNVDIDELEVAHFVFQHACPDAHRRLADDVDDVADLNVKNREDDALSSCIKRIFPIAGLRGDITYLEFEGIRVVRAGDEVCVDASSAAELSLIGAVLLQPQTVPLTRTSGLTGHAT